MEEEQRWPSSLVLVRHGETSLNLIKERLKKKPTKDLIIKTPCRDMDLPLTKKGIKQAKSAGRLLKKYPKFDVIITSPYTRTKQTADEIIKELGYKPKIYFEERTREKDFGVFDRYTKEGKKRYWPEEYDREKWEGKYYYRPPGGENYPDVALRIHSFLGTIIRKYSKKRILVVTHSIIILLFRKLLEHLSEKELLDIHDNEDLKNCSISSFIFDKEKNKNKLILKEWNRVK